MNSRKDVVNIIRETNVDWNVIIEECEWQFKNNPEVAFGMYLFGFFEELENGDTERCQKEDNPDIQETT